MRLSNPSSGRSNPRRERQRSADRRSWARRGRSSMRHRRQCSRGIGKNSARRWRRSSACWLDRHNRTQQSGKCISQTRDPSIWDLRRRCRVKGQDGPRRVRVYVRQVTGSPQRLRGVRPHVTPPLRLGPKCWPTSTGSMKRRSSATGPSVMSCISRNSKFMQTNYRWARRHLRLVIEEVEGIHAFHHGTPTLASRKLLGDISRRSYCVSNWAKRMSPTSKNPSQTEPMGMTARNRWS